MGFDTLGLSAAVLEAIEESGYTTPTPIQAQAIPLILEGRDLIGASQTGTGKTAAFALPTLSKIEKLGKPQILVLEPTRELAHQVAEQFEKYGKHTGLKVALLYGGVGLGTQSEQLAAGADIVVATPGRLVDHFYRTTMRFGEIKVLILDEVDRMLDMGFLRDVKRIVALLPSNRQSLFFSATLAPNIVELAQTILRNPARVSIDPGITTAERIEHQVCFVDRENKRPLLEQLLRAQASASSGKLTIVFSRTKHGANKLAKSLCEAGFPADAIHGNKSQAQREKALEKFKKGLTPVLVATDVAARGVDVKDVGLVVNFDLPNEPEAYVHRIGRTGRAGADGRAVSFCAEDEREFLREIEKVIKMAVPRWDDHAWHDESLADRHLRMRSGGGMVQGGGNRGGGRQSGGGNRGGGGGRDYSNASGRNNRRGPASR